MVRLTSYFFLILFFIGPSAQADTTLAETNNLLEAYQKHNYAEAFQIIQSVKDPQLMGLDKRLWLGVTALGLSRETVAFDHWVAVTNDQEELIKRKYWASVTSLTRISGLTWSASDLDKFNQFMWQHITQYNPLISAKAIDKLWVGIITADEFFELNRQQGDYSDTEAMMICAAWENYMWNFPAARLWVKKLNDSQQVSKFEASLAPLLLIKFDSKLALFDQLMAGEVALTEALKQQLNYEELIAYLRSKEEFKDLYFPDIYSAEDAAKNEVLWKAFLKQCKEMGHLPENLRWESNDTAPVFASEKAVKGGTVTSTITAWPLTLRKVGYNSNGSFRSILDQFDLLPISLHPVTEEVIPSLALAWAKGADGKSVYFKLDPDARWSDGKPVTTDDFLYSLYFYLNPFIYAGWYNTYYSETIDKIVKYDEHTFSVHLNQVFPNLEIHAAIRPMPAHFYGKLTPNFSKDFDWKIVPVTGPYQISAMDKGVSITFSRLKDWWAKDKRYTKYRYNPDHIVYQVIPFRDDIISEFLAGRLDGLGLVNLSESQQSALNQIVEQGYIQRVTFYNDTPRPSRLLSLNKDDDLLKEKAVREGIAYALNFETAFDEVMPGEYARAHTGFEGYGAFNNEQIRARGFDPQKAKTLFAKAGWQTVNGRGILTKEGKPLKLQVVYINDLDHRFLMVLQREAKQCGLMIEPITFNTSNDSFHVMLNKRHQAAWHGWGARSRVTGPTYWGIYHSINAQPGSNNFTQTKLPELDQLIDQYKSAVNLAQKQKLSRDIQQMIYEDCAAIPTYYQPFVREGFWRWVQFPLEQIPMTLASVCDLSLYWIDLEKKTETLHTLKNGKTFKVQEVTIKPTER